VSSSLHPLAPRVFHAFTIVNRAQGYACVGAIIICNKNGIDVSEKLGVDYVFGKAKSGYQDAKDSLTKDDGDDVAQLKEQVAELKTLLEEQLASSKTSGSATDADSRLSKKTAELLDWAREIDTQSSSNIKDWIALGEQQIAQERREQDRGLQIAQQSIDAENKRAAESKKRSAAWEREAQTQRSATKNCYHCNSGSGVCDECNGSGKLSIGSDNEMDCVSCNGVGRCGRCGGAGREKKDHDCHFCESGSGKCHYCNGRGKKYDYDKVEYADCFYCSHTGRCTACGGTGDKPD